MTRLVRPALALLVLAFAASCVRVYPPQAGEPAPRPQQPQANAAKEKSGEKNESPFEPWDEVLEDSREIEGFFTVHLKRDRSLLLEIPDERLGENFGLVMHYSRGVGDFNIQDGLWLSGFRTRLMRFKRVGDKIYLVERNVRFTAEEGSPVRRAMRQNVGHSIIAAFEIKSEHEGTGALLIDATDFFVSDYAMVSERLKFYYGSAPRLDNERSYVAEVMGFPHNVEIDALLTYAASGYPEFGGAGVSDPRSIPVGVRYSLFKLPEDPMTPRPADSRVGYFVTARFNLSRDRSPTQFRRYVNRWRLEKKNPDAELSEPVEPIVYYIGRGVPKQYRKYVEQGIEAWNKAFRAAGFKNAIVAKQAPTEEENPNWSAEDIRYSVVRWTPSYSMYYAIGPSQVDPRTGEILNADILISSLWPTFWLRDWDFLAATPSGAAAGTAANAPGASAAPAAIFGRYKKLRRLRKRLPQRAARRMCTAAFGKARQVALQHTLLAGLGVIDPTEPMPVEYLGAAIRDLVMHEVGHTLGLRHNFRASSSIPFDRLHDKAYTREHGVTLSVMDYGPVNVALDPDEQGYYWNPEVGSYDVWAIRYGYTPVAALAGGGAAEREAGDDALGERAGPRSFEARARALDQIAKYSTDPMHAYGTDEDALFGAFGVDPRTVRGDLGSDPLAWARTRTELVERIRPRLAERLIGEGMSWDRMRGAFLSLIFERFSALRPAVRMVGGLHMVRDHKGDPNAQPPFTPVPAERQRAAVELLVDEAFAPDAFGFTPRFLNRLAPNRWSHWGMGGWTIKLDFPIHAYVAGVQTSLLRALLAPARLQRIIDNTVRMPDGAEAYRLSELFRTLTDAIWSELEAAPARVRVNSFRRNLQRAYTERLTALLLRDELGFLGQSVPGDARALARLELRRIAQQIRAALESGAVAGRTTRAHLAASLATIERALEASVTLMPETAT